MQKFGTLWHIRIRFIKKPHQVHTIERVLLFLLLLSLSPKPQLYILFIEFQSIKAKSRQPDSNVLCIVDYAEF